MGDIIYRPLIEDMVWSYSRITCYETCPYKWFMRYILNEEESPMFYASYGKFMHRIIQMYYDEELTKDEMKVKFLSCFSKEVEGDRPSQQIVNSYIHKGVNYIDKFKPFDLDTLGVEESGKFNIDGIPFVGVIDYVGLGDTGYVIIDNKSRELKPRSNRSKPTKNDKEIDNMLKQLYLYSIIIKDKYGEYPSKLCFNCFKNNTFIEEPFNINDLNKTKEWAKRKIDNLMSVESGDFYPCVEFFQCKYLCGYHDKCCYWLKR